MSHVVLYSATVASTMDAVRPTSSPERQFLMKASRMVLKMDLIVSLDMSVNESK